MNKPTLQSVIYLGVGAVVFGVSALYLMVEIMSSGNEDLKLRALTLGLFFLAFVFGLGWISAFIHWHTDLQLEEMWKQREYESITPLTETMRLAARLTPEQAAVVPKFTAATAGLKGATMFAQGEVVWGHITADGVFIPPELLEKFLRRSGVTEIMAINQTSDKTPEREYLQAFTRDMVANGYATPASGNRPALWRDANTRAEVAAALGVSLELE